MHELLKFHNWLPHSYLDTPIHRRWFPLAVCGIGPGRRPCSNWKRLLRPTSSSSCRIWCQALKTTGTIALGFRAMWELVHLEWYQHGCSRCSRWGHDRIPWTDQTAHILSLKSFDTCSCCICPSQVGLCKVFAWRHQVVQDPYLCWTSLPLCPRGFPDFEGYQRPALKDYPVLSFSFSCSISHFTF